MRTRRVRNDATIADHVATIADRAGTTGAHAVTTDRAMTALVKTARLAKTASRDRTIQRQKSNLRDIANIPVTKTLSGFFYARIQKT